MMIMIMLVINILLHNQNINPFQWFSDGMQQGEVWIGPCCRLISTGGAIRTLPCIWWDDGAGDGDDNDTTNAAAAAAWQWWWQDEEHSAFVIGSSELLSLVIIGLLDPFKCHKTIEPAIEYDTS